MLLDPADLDVLAAATAELGRTLARIHGLLDLAGTEDTGWLAAHLAAGDGDDVVLIVEEEGRYRRTAERFNVMWALSHPLDRFLY